MNDKLYIETETEIKEVVVYDVYGRVQNLRNSKTQKLRNSIDVTDLNSGVYFVKIVTSEGEVVKRIIKGYGLKVKKKEAYDTSLFLFFYFQFFLKFYH